MRARWSVAVLLGLPRACEFTNCDHNAAICSLGTIRPGQAKTIKITARPTQSGAMSFDVSPEILSGSSPNAIDANDVLIGVHEQRHRGAAGTARASG